MLGQIHYVSVLKYIRIIDYKIVVLHIALMECDWARYGVDIHNPYMKEINMVPCWPIFRAC